MSLNQVDDDVLMPEDLTLDSEKITRLEENRYVVRTLETESDTKATKPNERVNTSEQNPLDDPEAFSSSTKQANMDIELATSNAPHGIKIALKADGNIAYYSSTATDIRDVFTDMLLMFAQQLDDETPPEEVLRVLLMTSDLEV